jgi:DNA mismatch repair ATPase MutS
MRHPLLEAAVPNSIVMRAGEGTIVTGSNMSGKSTFLRTVGVTAVMAQTVHTALAADYSAPVLRVRTCIGMRDDLLAGRSYYIAEVEAVHDLIRTSADGDAHLFLIDELFRGTNAVERIAAGEAVLRELVTAATQRKPHLAVVATHDAELVDLLADLYAPAYFGDDMTDAGLVFDYRIKAGRASTRNAIALLKHQGAPDRVVQAALARAGELDRLRGITSSTPPPTPPSASFP